jgi:hypothetical protein
MYVLKKSLEIKKKRNVMSVVRESAVSDESDKGMKTAAVRCHYDVNKPMIRFIN